jgi:hypothetical protein
MVRDGSPAASLLTMRFEAKIPVIPGNDGALKFLNNFNIKNIFAIPYPRPFERL